MRRRFATLLIFVAVFISMSSLAACGQTAKEDPVEEDRRKIESQVQQPDLTQPAVEEQTDRTIGEDIE